MKINRRCGDQHQQGHEVEAEEAARLVLVVDEERPASMA